LTCPYIYVHTKKRLFIYIMFKINKKPFGTKLSQETIDKLRAIKNEIGIPQSQSIEKGVALFYDKIIKKS
jgi:hypothetical protein